VGKWKSRSDFQGSPAAGFSTTQLAATIHAFRIAGLEVTLYGRFWVTPEAKLGKNHSFLESSISARGQLRKSFSPSKIDRFLADSSAGQGQDPKLAGLRMYGG
jgi:hypothetical protein